MTATGLRRFRNGGGLPASALAMVASLAFYVWPNVGTGIILLITLCFVGLARRGPNDGPD